MQHVVVYKRILLLFLYDISYCNFRNSNWSHRTKCEPETTSLPVEADLLSFAFSSETTSSTPSSRRISKTLCVTSTTTTPDDATDLHCCRRFQSLMFGRRYKKRTPLALSPAGRRRYREWRTDPLLGARRRDKRSKVKGATTLPAPMPSSTVDGMTLACGGVSRGLSLDPETINMQIRFISVIRKKEAHGRGQCP